MQVLQTMIEQIAQIVGTYLPRFAGAILLLVAAVVVANVLKGMARRTLTMLKIDQRWGQPGATPLSQTFADMIYGLTWLIFLPAILDALGLQGLLAPVQSLVNKLLGFLPNLLAAGLILVVGSLVARIVRQIVTNLLITVGMDRLSERVGLTSMLGKQNLSGLIGLLLYIFIMFPVLISTLEALSLAAITQPASDTLNRIFLAIPTILAALIILMLSIVIARAASGMLGSLLAGMGFNTLPERMGFKSLSAGQRTPADIVSSLVFASIVFFASIEAARMVGFTAVAELAAQFTVFAGQIITGLLIIAFGLWLANLAHTTIKESGVGQADVLSGLARAAILILTGAMALRQMGMASEIVNLAFGLLLGALAIATALAFGLGGRDFAARVLDDWDKAMRSKE